MKAGSSKLGSASSCITIDGAPLNWVIFSFWMSSSASAGLQRRMNTSRRPWRMDASSCACRPLTWNSGTAVSVVGWSLRAIMVATRSGEVIAEMAPM